MNECEVVMGHVVDGQMRAMCGAAFGENAHATLTAKTVIGGCEVEWGMVAGVRMCCATHLAAVADAATAAAPCTAGSARIALAADAPSTGKRTEGQQAQLEGLLCHE